MANRHLQSVARVYLPAVLVMASSAPAGAQSTADRPETPFGVQGEGAPAASEDRRRAGPESKARDGSNEGNSEKKPSWRVELDEAPPYQVRRAAGAVHETATIVASEIAGVDPPERVAAPFEDEAAGETSEETSPDVEGAGSEATDERADAEIRRLERGSDAPAESDERREATEALAGDGGVFERLRRWSRPSSEETLELEPHIDDPRWREAMDLLVDEEVDEARELADEVLDGRDGELPEAVDYAKARLEMCADEPEGRERMRALADGDGTIARLARRQLGDGPQPIEHDGEATASLGTRIRQAQRAAASGEFGEALQSLADLRKNLERAWERYQVRLAEAEIFLNTGKLASAARRFLGIYEMTRDWRIGDRIADKIETIEQEHGIEILPFAARVDRMRELIARGRYRKAKRVSIENARLADVSGEEVDGWSAYRQGLQAERERNRERADELFARAERLVESPVIRSRLYYGWARALRRIDRDDEAIELYERLCREYPRHRLCDDARYQAGRLLQYGGEHERAREKFADVVGLHPESSHLADSLWRGAFSAYLMEDYRAMERPLRRLRDHHGRETDASGLPLSLKARYWLGTAAYRRGELELAARRLQETINRGALTWYGRLAAARMERMGEEPVVPRPPAVLTRARLEDLGTLAIPHDERLEVAAQLARLGLYEEAIEELERQIDVRPVPDKARRLLASIQLVAGEVDEAHWEMARRLDDRPTPSIFDLRDWGIAYPVEYLDLAHKYGNRYDVSPFAIQGVIRQESGFRPAVKSWVGAVGLMQLMPDTANQVVDEYLDGGFVSRTALSKPDQNIRLGTMYLRTLTGYVRGRLPMAFAGYNAGPEPLDSWFRRYGDRQIDAWVESITYRQARGYARKVYTNYVRYAALYGGRLPSPTLELPDSFDEWGEVPELRPTDQSDRPVSLRAPRPAAPAGRLRPGLR